MHYICVTLNSKHLQVKKIRELSLNRCFRGVFIQRARKKKLLFLVGGVGEKIVFFARYVNEFV